NDERTLTNCGEQRELVVPVERPPRVQCLLRRGHHSHPRPAPPARPPPGDEPLSPGGRPLVPAVEVGEVARLPGLSQSGGAEIPVGADLARDGPQVTAQVLDGG